MSYRTYINDTQVFGNNECYEEWIEYIQSKGIEVDEDGCYDGKLTNFMEALEVIERITLRLSKERDSRNEEISSKFSPEEIKEVFGDLRGIFDLRHIPLNIEREESEDKRFRHSLFDKLVEITNCGYAFMPYSFYKACEGKLESAEKRTKGHLYCYQLKKNEYIEVSGG